MSAANLFEVFVCALAAILIFSLWCFNHLKISKIRNCPWWRRQGLNLVNFLDVTIGLYGLAGVLFMDTSFFEIFKLYIKWYDLVLTIASLFLFVPFLD